MSQKTIRYLLWAGVYIAILSSSSIITIAQSFNFEEDWRWTHFTTESGLPSNQVIEIIETNDSTIWACTSNGVVWFDGFRWIMIDSSKGLPQGSPVTIAKGNGDSVIVRFDNKMYIGNRHGFRPFLDSPSIIFVTYYDSSYIVLGVNSELYSLRNGEKIVLRQRVSQAWLSNAGNFYICSDTGFYKYTKNEFIQIFKKEKDYYKFQIGCFSENPNGKGIVYFLRPHTSNGLWLWDSSHSFHHNKSESGSTAACSDINTKGDVLCIYESGHVRIREHGKWSSPGFIPQPLHEAKYIRFASNNDLWVTTNQGIYLFQAIPPRWKFYHNDKPDHRDNINEILRTSKGDIWLGTGKGIIIRKPSGAEEWISNIGETELFAITGLAEDRQGNIWVSSGSSFPGAYRWDGNRWKHFQMGAQPAITMIHKIRKDKQGDLWFLGIKNSPISLIKNEPGAFFLHDTTFEPWTKNHSLHNQRVYSFSEGPDGSKWFGTSTGLYRWQGVKAGEKIIDTWKRWGIEEKLRWLRIFALAVDDSGTVWFGHGKIDESHGLGKITPEGKVQYITTKDGLVENQVTDLCIDSSGVIWISTAGGLSSFKNKIFINYTEKTGMKNLNLWPVQVFPDYVLVGSSGNGLGILDRTIPLPPSPIIQLPRAIVEDNSVMLQWKAFAFRGEITNENIQTRYRLNNGSWSSWSSVRTITMKDLSPASYRFQVQARGMLGQFAENGSSVAFVVLPPLWARPIFFIPAGLATIAFLFLVTIYINKKIVSDANLRKSEEKFRAVAETTPSAIFIYTPTNIMYANPAAVTLTGYSITELFSLSFMSLLHPRFKSLTQTYSEQQYVAKSLEVILLTKEADERWVELTTSSITFAGEPAILSSAFDITDRKATDEKILAYQEELRSLSAKASLVEERERRKMATYVHDQIIQSLAFCKLELSTIQESISSPKISSPMTTISNLLDQLINDSRLLIFNLSPPVLHQLGFEPAIAWLVDNFRKQHKLTVCYTSDHNTLELPEDMKIVLFDAVRELFVNAAKHAHASTLNIDMRREATCLIIRITDDGIGFDIMATKKLPDEQKGFGLFNVRERLFDLGCDIEIESTPGKGSTFTLIAPMNNSNGSGKKH